MKRVLFVHQNLPGQFRRLIHHLLRLPGFEVTGIGEQKAIARERFPPSFRAVAYPAPRGAGEQTHPYLKHFEACVRRGQSVARLCLDMKAKGYEPDVIVCHPGWGEGLFLRDVFPAARLVMFCEFYWSARGADMDFDPEFPATLDDCLRVRIKNSVLQQSLLAADAGIAPTHWQYQQHPADFRHKIRVAHEGVDTQNLKPDASARFTLPDGRVLTRGQPVLTYVARNLEPYRGFHVFMRALPRILADNPALRVLVVGGDEVSYGRAPPKGFGSYREAMMAELARSNADWSRVHFLGKLPFQRYVQVLQVSSLHVYLTYPFVLSWSMLEAMAAGAPVLASATAPVREVVRDGENGYLFDFFDVAGLAGRARELLAAREATAAVAGAGRATVMRDYDFESVGLPVYLRLLRGE